MKTAKDICARISFLTEELMALAKRRQKFPLPKRKRGKMPIASRRIRIRERFSSVEGKLKALKWVLKEGINDVKNEN